jgi:hypothetical protein
VEDPQLGTIDTPNGRVTFIQLVGVTAEQHEAAANGAAEAVLEPVRLTDPLLVTDPATGTLAG